MWREEGQDDRFLCDPRFADWQGGSEREKGRRRKREVFHSALSVLFVLQERSHSHGFLALQTGREVEPTADA